MTGEMRYRGKTDPYYTHGPSAFELVSGPEGFTLPDDPPAVKENP